MRQATTSNSLLAQAHQCITTRLHNGAIAIDATMGNGHDTLFLAQQVAPTGIVYGFDIQPAALTATRTRLQKEQLLTNCHLVLRNHAYLTEHILAQHRGHITTVMFNLGYLPGANKQIITQTNSTLAALSASLNLLAPHGLLTLLAYPGHPGGDVETMAVAQWCAGLDDTRFRFNTYYSKQPTNTAPRLFVIEKSDLKICV